METICFTKQKIFTIWPFTEKVCQLTSWTLRRHVDCRLNDRIRGLWRSRSSGHLVLLAIFICEILGAGIGSSFPFLAPAQDQQVLENVDADLLPQTPGSRDAEDNVLHTDTCSS